MTGGNKHRNALRRIVALHHALSELVKTADTEDGEGFAAALENARAVLDFAPEAEDQVAAVLPALRTVLDDYPLRYVTKAETPAAFNDVALWLEAQERAALNAAQKGYAP